MSGELCDLVDRWVRGWARLGEFEVRRGTGGAWSVAVNSASRRREHVAADVDIDQLTEVVAATSEATDVWLTVLGDVDTSALSRLEAVTDGEAFMSCPLDPAPVDEQVVVDADGPRADARVVVDGEVAASGSVVVHERDAVFARIETSPRHRRRGYARRIMTALTTWAYERGATLGLLAASPDGRLLYDQLGWRTVCPMTSYRGTSGSRAEPSE